MWERDRPLFYLSRLMGHNKMNGLKRHLYCYGFTLTYYIDRGGDDEGLKYSIYHNDFTLSSIPVIGVDGDAFKTHTNKSQ
jgi:hypothetical protein